jgi:hypothetical protein
MVNNRILVRLVYVIAASLTGDCAFALNSYLPISQTVSRGSYCAPNYLSTVATAVGREEAYRLFSDVITERYPHAVGRFGKDEVLVQALRKSRIQRRLLLGSYAEKRYLVKNRDAGWLPIADRFAPQRDVWRRVNGRIQYAQIKVHGIGPSAPTMRDLAGVYLDSMRKDSGRGQASLFLVPDDHVGPIKALIDEKSSTALRNGDLKEAQWLAKQKERVNPYGATYETLAAEADAGQAGGLGRIVSRCAGPVITVLFLGGSVGYDTYRWSSGELSGSEYVLQLEKTGSVFAVGMATAYLVSKSDWLQANPYRAGGIITAVVFLAEEGWLIYEHGGFGNAFSSPGFYVKTGGNLGAATLGLICCIEGGKLGAAIGTPLGPWGTFTGGVGGAIIGGAVGGMAGYLGGAALTDWTLQTLAPKFYYGMKLEEIAAAENQFNKELKRLTDLSIMFAPAVFAD